MPNARRLPDLLFSSWLQNSIVPRCTSDLSSRSTRGIHLHSSLWSQGRYSYAISCRPHSSSRSKLYSGAAHVDCVAPSGTIGWRHASDRHGDRISRCTALNSLSRSSIRTSLCRSDFLVTATITYRPFVTILLVSHRIYSTCWTSTLTKS